MGFSVFGLAETILKGIGAAGYNSPTEIQSKAIPIALSGKDIIGCAPTGTGKTAAFVLPTLHLLHRHFSPDSPQRYPRVLILAPTRELTLQIVQSVITYGGSTGLRALSIYGGVDIREQIRKLRRGVEIVAATPGRLLDHIGRRTIDLSRVEILILDEADRMYDMGFIKDVRRIIKAIPRKRQTMLFSATMSPEIRKLISEIQVEPKVVEIGKPCSPAQTVEQHFYTISHRQKNDLLPHILEKEPTQKVLVFSRTKSGADCLSRKLCAGGFRSAALHADRTQSQRRRVLDGFRNGKYKVLVATDIAARGIDVEGISHVVNFDAPLFAQDYIHRIGRTGRGEALGKAITFVCDDEHKHVRSIERLIGKRFMVNRYPGFEYLKCESSVLEEQGMYKSQARGGGKRIRLGANRWSKKY